MKRSSTSSNGNCSCSKFGSYGTFIFPEMKGKGFWRFQTNYPQLVKHMRLRDWNSKSPWEVTGWGTIWIFRRRFSGSHEAKRSVQRILAKIGYPEIEFTKLELGGFETVQKAPPLPQYQQPSKNSFKTANWPKPPPCTRKKRRRGLQIADQVGGFVS